MLHGRLTRLTFGRLALLLAANAALLVAIRLLLKPGASFAEVLRSVLSNTTPVALAGLGMTAIIFTGAIDLSVGAIVVFAGTVFGVLVYYELPPLVCYVACMLAAWLLTMLNGYAVRWLRIPAIIVTLGGLAAYRGLALILADVAITDFAGNISVHDDAYHGPGKFYAPWIFLVAAVAGIGWACVAQTPRRWLALGSSAEACRLLGLSPGRILQSAFTFAGLFFALGALVQVTNVQAIEPARLARGFELQVIGAVVLGGTNIFGGEGSFAGTVLGALLLQITTQLLQYAGANVYVQDAIIGGVILAVIGVDCLLHRRQRLREELA